MTPEECAQFKLQIKKEIEENNIRIYEFPENDQDQDDEDNNPNCRVPFAVVGSNTVIEKDGKKIRGRKYPWGIAEVENIDHCDFTVLRDMLIRTHMQDLKDVTNNVHYENFRTKKLSSVTTCNETNAANNKSPIGILADEKAAHMVKMRKMENEMEEVFRQKVDEKRKKLVDSEADLARRHEAMKKKLENEYHLLEERKRKFEQEKQEFERSGKIEGGNEEDRAKGRKEQGHEEGAFLKNLHKNPPITTLGLQEKPGLFYIKISHFFIYLLSLVIVNAFKFSVVKNFISLN